jgi:hypothetical protein
LRILAPMMPTRIFPVAMMIFPLYSQVDADDSLVGPLHAVREI